MANIVYYVAATLDGYIADSHHKLDWLMTFQLGDDATPYDDFYQTVGAVIMGAETYSWILENSPEAWPYADVPAFTDIRFIRKHFNVVLERTVRELRGEPCLGLEEFAPTKQEIVCSRSFGERVTEYEQMRQAICSYAARGAEKLRGEHQYCRYVSAFVKTSPFAVNEQYYGNHASTKLLTPTQDTRDIIAAACRCLDTIWQDGHRFQKAGFMLGDFFSQGVAQLNLFDDNGPKPNSEQLMKVLDHLNAKDGRGTLYFAGQGVQQAWKMKRDMLSPHYTTRFMDLPCVK